MKQNVTIDKESLVFKYLQDVLRKMVEKGKSQCLRRNKSQETHNEEIGLWQLSPGGSGYLSHGELVVTRGRNYEMADEIDLQVAHLGNISVSSNVYWTLGK